MYQFTMPADKWDELNPDKQVIRRLIQKHRKIAAKLSENKRYYEGAHRDTR